MLYARGFFSAILVFVVVLHMMVPGISVKAVPTTFR